MSTLNKTMKAAICLLTFLTLISFSCNKIKNKKNQVADKIDNVFPKFNSTKADTKYNKKRFKQYFEVELTQDVKDIYCYGDFLGIDYKVLFSFTCDSTTIQRIIEVKKMEMSTEEVDNGLYLKGEFEWWDKEKTLKIKPYKQGKEYEYWEYLWYDKENKKAYYEEFSI